MKTKMILVVTGALLLLAIFLGYRINTFTHEEQARMAQELSAKQSQYLVQSLESQIRDLKSQLVDLTKMKELKVKLSDKNFGPFQYIVALDSGADNKAKAYRWKLSASGANALTDAEWNEKLIHFATEGISAGTVSLAQMNDFQGANYLAVQMLAQLKSGAQPQNVFIIGLMSKSEFTKKFPKESNDVLTYALKAADAIWLKEPVNSSDVELVKADFKIPGSNLTLITTTPMTRAPNSLVMEVVMAVLGIGFMLLGALIFLQQKQEDNIQEMLAGVERAQSMPRAVMPAPAVATSPVQALPAPSAEPVKTTAAVSAPPATPAAKPTVNEAELQMQAYTKIASSFIHEIRSPLLAILGHAQLAKSRAGDETAKTHCQSIENEARLARDVVDKLSHFVGIGKAKKTKVNLRTLIQMALKPLEAEIMQKGIKLSQTIPDNAEVIVETQAMSLALTNIFRNAIESMERSLKKELNIQVQGAPQYFELVISDTGEGISAENKNKIFEPFFTTRTKAQHQGLGLSASMGILKDHQASIDVSSIEGQGTNVKIHLLLEPKVEKETVLKAPQAPTKAMVTTATSSATPEPAAVDNPATDALVQAAPAAPKRPAPKKIEGDELLAFLNEDAPVEIRKEDGLRLEDRKNIKVKTPDMPQAHIEKPSFDAPEAPSKLMEEHALASVVIDPPSEDLIKPKSRTDDLKVNIRRPGARV